MYHSYGDITTYAWLDHESIGFPGNHVASLRLFRDSVVHPSLKALDDEIETIRRSDSPGADFFIDDYAALFQTTVEGYLIAVQSMWERGLRSLLVQREKKLNKNPQLDNVKRATWSGKTPNLQDHFLRLMGFPLENFEFYADLDLLQNLGNAIRHGDGASARKVHQTCPELWCNWIAPGQTIFAGPFQITASPDDPPHPPFESITLSEDILKQMIQSVMWFWDDIENIRCNSFQRKSPSVVAKLSAWREDHTSRRYSRIWSPTSRKFSRDVAKLVTNK